MTKRKKKSPMSAMPLDTLQQLNLNAAGLDIGAEEIYTCVPADRDEQSIRVFGTFTTDLYALADWLEACGIETVAMESTGIYWIPVYEILEDRGFSPLPGQRSPPQERAGAEDRCPGLSVDSAIAHLRSAAGLVSSARRDLRPTGSGSASRQPDSLSFGPHPAHAEGPPDDERQIDPSS